MPVSQRIPIIKNRLTYIFQWPATSCAIHRSLWTTYQTHRACRHEFMITATVGPLRRMRTGCSNARHPDILSLPLPSQRRAASSPCQPLSALFPS